MMNVKLCVLSVLALCARGYIWDQVSNPDNYDVDTVYFQSDIGTYGSCGYTTSAVGRFAIGTGRCYIPFNSEEFEVVLPYDVLVNEVYNEFMIWDFLTDANEIRDRGVLACDNCASGSAMYVCASQSWGPGKLIVGDDNSVRCYVSYNGNENQVSSFYTLVAQPAYEYTLTDVNYYLDELELLEDNPTQLTSLIVINQDSVPQQSTHTLTYSKTSSNEWENAYGMTIGVAMSVTAGILEFFETGWEVSTEETFEYSYGGASEETIEISTEAALTVPAESTCEVTITGRTMVADVPYDATARVSYSNGVTFTETISGVYEGLSVNQDTINYEPCVPL